MRKPMNWKPSLPQPGMPRYFCRRCGWKGNEDELIQENGSSSCPMCMNQTVQVKETNHGHDETGV